MPHSKQTAEEHLNRIVAQSALLRLLAYAAGMVILPMMAIASAWVVPAYLRVAVMVIAAFAYIVNALIGILVPRVRPYRLHSSITLLQHEPWGTKSFPSDHAMFAFFIAGILTILEPDWVAVAYGCAVVVALSRVAVGVHALRDVIAGMLIGIAWSMLFAGLILSETLRRGFYV